MRTSTQACGMNNVKPNFTFVNQIKFSLKQSVTIYYIDKSKAHEADESKIGTRLYYTNLMKLMKLMKAKAEQAQAGGQATANSVTLR
jgi:hypothetical protein